MVNEIMNEENKESVDLINNVFVVFHFYDNWRRLNIAVFRDLAEPVSRRLYEVPSFSVTHVYPLAVKLHFHPAYDLPLSEPDDLIPLDKKLHIYQLKKSLTKNVRDYLHI